MRPIIDLAKAPRLEYHIAITTPGSYQVWADVRSSWESAKLDQYDRPIGPYAFNAKKLRLGVANGRTERLLAGDLVTSPDGRPVWRKAGGTDPIVITAPTTITLRAYAATPGVRIDRFILSNDPGYQPE